MVMAPKDDVELTFAKLELGPTVPSSLKKFTRLKTLKNSARNWSLHLSVNVKFLIEGEEEVSGRSLPEFVRTHAGRLRTDYLLRKQTGAG